MFRAVPSKLVGIGELIEEVTLEAKFFVFFIIKKKREKKEKKKLKMKFGK